MSYLYENEFVSVYDADIGSISKITDSESKYFNKLIYEPGRTLDGYCYKDYNNFKNAPDEICYIPECKFEKTLFVDYVNKNKEKLIRDGVLSTANSIKREIRDCLEMKEYFYEYQRNGVVNTIEAKDFDEELIDMISEIVFEIVDWQLSSSLIYEMNFKTDIEDYYSEKLKINDLQL